jgi:hypothetical protein
MTTIDRTPLATPTRACLGSPGGQRLTLTANLSMMLLPRDSHKIILWCYTMSLGRVSEN